MSEEKPLNDFAVLGAVLEVLKNKGLKSKEEIINFIDGEAEKKVKDESEAADIAKMLSLKKVLQETQIFNKVFKVKEEKEIVELDNFERSISDVAQDVSKICKENKNLFYRANSNQIVEVGKIKLSTTGEHCYTGFREMKDKRFITYFEKYGIVGYYKKTRVGELFEVKSLSPGKADIILKSHILEEALPQIERIFSSAIPILYEDELTFIKKGYDPRFSSWMDYDSPEITDTKMSVEEAKKIIDKIYSEFCFKSEQDRVNAISGLLTPFLKGLFEKFNTPTPGIFYTGNREGVGKDYGAAIPNLVHEGQHKSDTPICDGGKPNNEELRKKITSAIKNGRKSMHFANNRGFLNSGILEEFITSPVWTDRELGKNDEISLPNEMNKSLSGNIPIRYTPDLVRRVIFVNLFYSQEDINARIFEKSNLHEWILENREKILSALYSLIKNWVEKGKPKGKVPFSSFPEWSKICGGIMECAGYGNPCIIDKDNMLLSGDTETDEMKELYKICFEKYPNQPIKKNLIIEIVNNQDELFSYFDFDKRGDQTKFSIKLRKYLGREFNKIEMNILNFDVKTANQEYIFKKLYDNDGNVGNVGNVTPYPTCEIKNIHIGGKKDTKVSKVTKIKGLDQFSNEEIEEAGYSREEIIDTLEEGDSQ